MIRGCHLCVIGRLEFQGVDMEYAGEMVKVVVLTRFNVVFTDDHFQRDKAGSLTRTDAWLKRRFELFGSVCLPSLMAQTDPAFHWMVFFSEGTPGHYREHIADIQQSFPQFMPIFLVDGENLVERTQREVAQLLGPLDRHVITLRIDNDDAFHRDMVARVRREFHGQEDEYINFLDGAQADLEAGLVVAFRKYSNPFMARVERVGDRPVRTVFEVRHNEAEGSRALRNVTGGPMWLQLIHQGNVTNRFGSASVLWNCDLHAAFGITHPYRHDRMAAIRYVLGHHLYRRPRNQAGRLWRSLTGR